MAYIKLTNSGNRNITSYQSDLATGALNTLFGQDNAGAGDFVASPGQPFVDTLYAPAGAGNLAVAGDSVSWRFLNPNTGESVEYTHTFSGTGNALRAEQLRQDFFTNVLGGPAGTNQITTIGAGIHSIKPWYSWYPSLYSSPCSWRISYPESGSDCKQSEP